VLCAPTPPTPHAALAEATGEKKGTEKKKDGKEKRQKRDNREGTKKKKDKKERHRHR
jgi:hypothetical protein